MRPPPGSILFPYTTLFRSSGAFSNDGSLAVQAGTLRLAGANGTSNGSIQVAAGAVLNSTRLNSSHTVSAYATGCVQKTIAGGQTTLAAGMTYGLDAFQASA